MNRETAKKDAQKRNHAMLQVELKMLFNDEMCPYIRVKPHHLREGYWTWKDKDPDDQLEWYYFFANRDILPLDKFVCNYMTGSFDAEECVEEVREWDRERRYEKFER